jgi:hypothetical protein
LSSFTEDDEEVDDESFFDAEDGAGGGGGRPSTPFITTGAIREDTASRICLLSTRPMSGFSCSKIMK